MNRDDFEHFECGKYPYIFRGILSVPQNTVMDLNNVTKMSGDKCRFPYV